MEIINELQLVIDDTTENIEKKLSNVTDFELIEKNQYDLLYRASVGLKIRLYGCDDTPFMQQVFLKNCSGEFAEAFAQQYDFVDYANCENEESIFIAAKLNYIPACQRESFQ